MRYLLFIFVLLGASLPALAERGERGATDDLLDIAIAGTPESARITIWSTRPLETNIYLFSEPSAADNESGPFYLVVSADVPLGGLSKNLTDTMTALLSRRVGVRQGVDFNSDLLLKLQRPILPTRILNLDPIGNESRYRTIIDLEQISLETALKKSTSDSLAYKTSLTQRQKIHAAAATTISSPVEIGPPSRADEVKPVTVRATASEASKPKLSSTPDDIVNPVGTRLSGANLPNKPLPRVQKTPPFTIVIDPGHGGFDPGASKFAVVEKSIVLKAALELKALLETNPNYIVKLTRDTDTFISLEKRVESAREWKADLFISIHADSFKSNRLRGASVYTLSEKGLFRSKQLAAENDWALPADVSENDSSVASILSDFAQRDTLSKSSQFADILVGELRPVTKLINNSHRSAGYVVLFASDVPAVLLEMGFLSNKEDATKLAKKSGRQPTLAATKRAIDKFFEKYLETAP